MLLAMESAFCNIHIKFFKIDSKELHQTLYYHLTNLLLQVLEQNFTT